MRGTGSFIILGLLVLTALPDAQDRTIRPRCETILGKTVCIDRPPDDAESTR